MLQDVRWVGFLPPQTLQLISCQRRRRYVFKH
jgi:hypothetical protein